MITTVKIDCGPVFRGMNRHGQALAKRLSAEGVAIVVQRAVEKLGYDPRRFAGHSLRAGLATSAAASGEGERAIMNQTGHRTARYPGRQPVPGNAADGLGF